MTDATSRFAALVREPEGEIALDEGALLIAAHAHAGLDIDARLTQLDQLAGTVRGRSPAAITDALFTAGGFAGNTVDYYDPSNSYLDDVLDRRLGIPITLSVLMIEVGRRVGVALHGVGMPGHFLVGADGGQWYDPFHGGAHLTEEACAELFTSVQGRGPFDRRYLAPVGASAILDRVLANLQQTLLARSPAAAAWPTRLRLLFPSLPPDRRGELAAVLGSLGRFSEAAAELDRVARDLSGEGGEHAARAAAELRSRAN